MELINLFSYTRGWARAVFINKNLRDDRDTNDHRIIMTCYLSARGKMGGGHPAF
jgi:hypothetical protein